MMLAVVSWQGAELWPVALMATALAAAGISFLYPPQIGRAVGRWRWALPCMRALALATLAMSILRPVIVRSRTVEEQGAVLVLVDCSASMGVTDRTLVGRGAGERAVVGQLVAIADQLGLLPEGARSRTVAEVSAAMDRLESLADDIARAQRELDFARLSGRAVKEPQDRLRGAIAEFLATAKQARDMAERGGAGREVRDALGRLCAEPRAPERAEWIRGIQGRVAAVRGESGDRRGGIQESQDAVDAALYASHPDVRRACDELSRLSRAELGWRILTDRRAGVLSRLEKGTPVLAYGVGNRTWPLALQRTPGAFLPGSDLTGGIAQALQQVGHGNVQAIVLLSDGRQVNAGSGQPVGAVPWGVPVFAVYAGSPLVRDLGFERVDLPESAFVNEVLAARIYTGSRGIDLGSVSGHAQLWVGGRPADARSLPIQDQHAAPIELRARVASPGAQKMTITLPVGQGEATIVNNQVERWVKVLSHRLKVTLLATSPNWDYRYVRDLLMRTSWVELREALVAAGDGPSPISHQSLLEQDLVILHDVPRSALPMQHWIALDDLMRERGASVLMVPGAAFSQESPYGYAMGDWLPYDPKTVRPVWRTWPGQSPQYHLAPASNAETMPLLRLDDDPDVSRRRWDELPGFYRYLWAPELRPGARVILTERQAPQAALLTEMRVGAGRAFFLGMHETWRWRKGMGEREQERFWLQLVRHAVDEPYAATDGQASLDASPLGASPGQPVRIRARMLGPALPRRMGVWIMRDGEGYREVSLEATDDRSGRYEAMIADLPEGEYELRLVDESGIGAALSLALRIRPSVETEMANVQGDRDFLQRLAEASGGKCLGIEQARDLPKLLEEVRRRQPHTSEWTLWDSPYLFGFVLSCLAAEWAVRKRLGLA